LFEVTVDHLVKNVLPAAGDYGIAENALTQAFCKDTTPATWEAAARTAKRRAAEVAIAIDGLTDRCFVEVNRTKSAVRNDISALCVLPGTSVSRVGAHDRVRGVSNAYKHQTLHDSTLPIASDNDVLVVGSGWGVDGYGVGKFGGPPEVLVVETSGQKWKFLGDVPTAIAAWFRFLAANGAILPPGPFVSCGLQVHP
jgi:hypothetical protein